MNYIDAQPAGIFDKIQQNLQWDPEIDTEETVMGRLNDAQEDLQDNFDQSQQDANRVLQNQQNIDQSMGIKL